MVDPHDDDGFWDRELAKSRWRWEEVFVYARIALWLIVLAGLSAITLAAFAQTPLPAPTLMLPSQPIPPERQAKNASLGVMFTGEILPPDLVTVAAMQQSHGWKEQMLKNSLPRPCNDCVTIEYKITGMVNGVIAPQSPSQTPPYLAGWVHKDARFVVLKIDNSAQFNITPTDVTPPIVRQWRWDIPAFYNDGKEHTVCTRVFKRHADYPKVTTLVDMGPLDNAKCPGGVAQFKFR